MGDQAWYNSVGKHLEERDEKIKALEAELERLRQLIFNLHDGLDDYWRQRPENAETMETFWDVVKSFK